MHSGDGMEGEAYTEEGGDSEQLSAAAGAGQGPARWAWRSRRPGRPWAWPGGRPGTVEYGTGAALCGTTLLLLQGAGTPSQRLPKAGRQQGTAAVKRQGRPAVREMLSRPDTIPSSSFPLTNTYAALDAAQPQSSNGTTVQQLDSVLSAAAGRSSTIVARGQIDGAKCVDMLIDTGASCCFVRRSCAERMKAAERAAGTAGHSDTSRPQNDSGHSRGARGQPVCARQPSGVLAAGDGRAEQRRDRWTQLAASGWPHHHARTPTRPAKWKASALAGVHEQQYTTQPAAHQRVASESPASG